MTKLKPIMFVGTGSDVGKSVITSAFCRIFLQDGYTPAPFKAQNMALNSFATADGLEIGRAQAVQAEAAGVMGETDMNPLLLKPSSDQVVQVVLNGKSIGNQSAAEYFKSEDRGVLRKVVNGAFDRLAARYNPIVMEGAGSISEINLREVDLVNMPMAIHAEAVVIVIADIDKGGVFASLYGSMLLLTEEERRLIKGILINKFRGDISLFTSGVKMLEELCGVPVLGVIPYFKDIYIEEEDSVMLESKHRQAMDGKVNIAVILLRHLSNFTDFNALERDARVHLYYTNHADEIEKAHIIIIPGTKNTLADLYELRKSGIAQSILRASEKGASVLGICGGYQMMGQEIYDRDHVEGAIDFLPGLGMLPLITHIEGEKITRQVRFQFKEGKQNGVGYEIHLGKTTVTAGAVYQPLNLLDDGTVDGYFLHERCFGTYIHGILDNADVIDYLLHPYLNNGEKNDFDLTTFKEEQYNKLANHIRGCVDLEVIYRLLQE